MHQADILALVGKSKYRFFTNISKKYGVSPERMRAALRRPQKGAEIAISKAIDIPLHILWPDRWDANGERLVHRGQPRRNAA